MALILRGNPGIDIILDSPLYSCLNNPRDRISGPTPSARRAFSIWRLHPASSILYWDRVGGIGSCALFGPCRRKAARPIPQASGLDLFHLWWSPNSVRIYVELLHSCGCSICEKGRWQAALLFFYLVAAMYLPLAFWVTRPCSFSRLSTV